MRELKDKVVVIVGGATGIGAATAHRLGEEGAKVIVADINIAGAEETAAEVNRAGGIAHAIDADVTDDSSLQSLFDEVIRAFGRLDALHANVANLSLLPRDGDTTTLSHDVFHDTMDINLYGYIACTRHALPLMVKNGGGVIVYTSSSASFGGAGNLLAYSMSKAGVNVLVRNVASGWGKKGIRVNAIAPGFVLTENARANVDQRVQDRALAASQSGFHGLPEDVAAAVAFLMSADARWINGQTLCVDGGLVMR
jgi:NAD(P)-dependent dehydrogenase (short-subunit alcohol dehydrogenase family)